MNVPTSNSIPRNSASSHGQCIGVATVSGPRTVKNVCPRYLVTTISQCVAAREMKVPVRSLWLRHTWPTNGESDALYSMTNFIFRRMAG